MPRRQPTYRAKLKPIKVEGLDKVLKNLDKYLKRGMTNRGSVINATARGLVLSAYAIRVDTEKTSPTTPVDLGNLRASFFIVSAYGGVEDDPLKLSGTFRNRLFTKMQMKASEMKAQHSAVVGACQAEALSQRGEPFVLLGYSANYALWVHEMLGADFKERTPAAGAQWFQKAIYRNRKKILEIVKDNAQIS